MEDYNVHVELDARLPISDDDIGAVVDPLLDLIEPFGGSAGRTADGRVELIFTVPADNVRQATSAGLALVTAEGYTAFAVEAMPQEEFLRRSRLQPVPELVSVPQAAELLGIKRQSALELVQRGSLTGRKVGDTWVIPRAAVEDRAGVDGLRWEGVLILINVVSDLGQLVEPDAIDFDLPVPVLDERGRVIGIARSIKMDSDAWTADGIVTGLQPGEYSVVVQVDRPRWSPQGEVDHLKRGDLTAITVLTGDGRGSATFPQAQIRVSEAPGHMNLSRVHPPAHMVVSYP